MYQIVYRKQALRDKKKIEASHLEKKVKELIAMVKQNPFQKPPPFEKLVGDLEGSYSRRINIQHRLVYQVYEEEKIVKVLRMWTHYEV